jgi:hypothetical protein
MTKQQPILHPAPGEMTAFMASRLRAGLKAGAVIQEAATRFGREPKDFSARVYQIKAAIKRGGNPGGIVPPSPAASPEAEATPPPPTHTHDRRSRFTPEHIAVVEQLVRDFSRGNGKVDWSAAFAAHPEWKESLSQYPIQTVYGWGARLRNRQRKTLSANGQAGHALARGEQPSQIAPEPIATHPVERSLICCPKCGENVERWENLSPLLALPPHVIERLVKMATSVKAMKGAHL